MIIILMVIPFFERRKPVQTKPGAPRACRDSALFYHLTVVGTNLAVARSRRSQSAREYNDNFTLAAEITVGNRAGV
jgi:hypothetical protein